MCVMTSIGEMSPAMTQSLCFGEGFGKEERRSAHFSQSDGFSAFGLIASRALTPWCPCGAPSPPPSRRASPACAWMLHSMDGMDWTSAWRTSGERGRPMPWERGRRLGFSRTFLDNLEDFLVEADVGEGLRDGADGSELAALVIVVLLVLGGSLLLLLLLLLSHVFCVPCSNLAFFSWQPPPTDATRGSLRGYPAEREGDLRGSTLTIDTRAYDAASTRGFTGGTTRAKCSDAAAVNFLDLPKTRRHLPTGRQFELRNYIAITAS